MSTDLQSLSSADALLNKVINEGVESRVEVNQRLLIDKLLARYSSDFVIFRELIQNSDDAQATTFRLEITCDTSIDVSNFQQDNPDKLISQQHQSNGLFSNIEKFFRNRRGNTKVSPDQIAADSVNHSQLENSVDNSVSSQEIVFHNSEITEIRAVNNGLIFTEVDWKRVATIAEGNTNVDAIGQFGVGFFTVFSYAEQPIIKSGNECMVFVWKDGKSLTTFRTQLPVEEQSSTTSVILKMRNQHILQTKSTVYTDFAVTDENRNDESKSTGIQKNGGANDMVPKIDLNQLKAYFIKVLSFTKHINEIAIIINGLTVFQVNKTKKIIPASQTKLTFKKSPIPINNDMLHLSSSVHTEQTFTIAHGPSITLNHVDVEATVNIDQNLHNKIRQTLQKSLPHAIHIQLLFPSINTFNKQQLLSPTNNDLHTRILNSLIPLKLENDEIVPSGHIFIGLATHQTTGIGMHVYSQLIPTIERVNLDLQTPYIKIWNKEILTSAGKITRLIYDQMIRDSLRNYDIILASYSFQPTVPNTEIGSILLDGFFSLTKSILVPVKQTPSDSQLSLLPSTQAFVTNSQYISLFLSIPFVPFEFETKYFFSILKHRRLVHEISYATIVNELQKTILSPTEFVALLNWLCSGKLANKACIKQILYTICFRETTQSPIITLHKLKFYDLSNISSHLPLPSNVLPANIATHLSCEQLQKKLFLSEIAVNYLFDFYLEENQQKLFCDINTSVYLLSFISQHWDRMNALVCRQIKTILSALKCIPTTQGMKLPHESYVRSSTLSPNLPFITLNIPQNSIQDDNENDKEDDDDKAPSNEQLDNPVSIELLKWIGCRTIQVPGGDDARKIRSNESSSNFEENQVFIQDLLKKRKNMSEADINALMQSKCLTGTTFDLTSKKKTKFIPQDLHFPSVAVQLNWPTLTIIDWPDIDSHSPEYAFLKEIGVREVPNISILIDRIIEEHNENQRQQSKITLNEYKVPNGLTFLAKNFHQHYIKQWDSTKSERPFLPSYYPTTTFDENNDKKDIRVELLAPSSVFKDESPLFAIPIPAVIELFASHCDISFIGVKQRPTLSIAFNNLIKRKNEILTVQSASKLFSYLSTLDGLNHSLIDQIANHAFIPVSDQHTFVRPSQVFIRSSLSDSTQLLDKMDTSGLIDYVDYSPDANLFLCNVGVRNFPPPGILAELLLNRQAKYFSDLKDSTNDLLPNKLCVYTACLKQLAYFSKHTDQLRIDPLETRLKNEPWCLGYQTIETNDDIEHTTYKIVKPTEIYLNDDQQCIIDLNPLCAPNDDDLKNLYAKYGSKWLSESIQRTLLHKGRFNTSNRSNELLELIQHRLNMFFVNNRGEKIYNASEDRIEILRNNLSVYETENIQCQLTLQNKTITLKSSECSSCALEYKNNKVELFIRSDVSVIEYFDVANELARFVMQKQDRFIVYGISNILSSTLESLKRQGIPVDRLLKITDKQLTIIGQQHEVQEQEQQHLKDERHGKQQKQQINDVQYEEEQQQQQLKNVQHKEQQQQQIKNAQHEEQHQEQLQTVQYQEQQQQQQQLKNVKQQNKFKQQRQQSKANENQKNLTTSLSRPTTDRHESHNLQTHIKYDRVSDFGQNKSTNTARLSTIIRAGRAYTQSEFNNRAYVRNETNTSCETVPAAHMTRYKDLFHSIPLYVEENVTVTTKMIDQAKQLAYLLNGLAVHVFKILVQTIHMFRDIDGVKIAFNATGAVFFNLRYFEQVFADELNLLLATSSNPLLCRIVNFYFMVMCHELTHNIHSGHSSHFITDMESIAVEYMPNKELFLTLFSLENYA